MAANNKTEAQNVQDIRQALGEEVIPQLTGKPSRVLKDQRPKKPAKKVTAGGASLYEIAAAIAANPGANVKDVIKQGQKEAKERERQEHGGKFARGTKGFLTGALGGGLGGWLGSVLDTKSQKDAKKLNDVHRQYEEGGKIKAGFMKGLLGQGMGGALARATTSMSTKVSAFEKYKSLTESPVDASGGYKQYTQVGKPATKNFKPVVTVISGDRKDAEKALSALGYTKQEIQERLKNAPSGAKTEDLIKHGLNPSATPLPAPVANAEASRQLSMFDSAPGVLGGQDQAAKDKKEEEEKKKEEKDEKWKEDVKAELEEVKKNTDKKGGLGWLLLALGAAIGALIYKYWDKIKAAWDAVTDTVSRIIEWIDQNVYTPLVDFVSRYVIEPIMEGIDGIVKGYEWVSEHVKKIYHGVAKFFGLEKDDPAPPATPQAHPQPPHSGPRSGIIQRPTTAAAMAPPAAPSPTGAPSNATPPKPPSPAVAARPPPSASVAPKAPPITPTNMGKASQSAADMKASNDQQDQASAMMAAVGGGGPNQVDTATLQGVNDIKKALPALAAAQGGNDGGGVLIKLGNDESSVSGYMGQIFDHPATWGAKP